ncbi:MAG: NAD-dependent epimerase/dehydratase family protein, partial [Candidatus Omnitrophica bacterium]|nr:NAD-dependent epimerase/dehydratase family protein [Candidatus Omnitrophota bacterium]
MIVVTGAAGFIGSCIVAQLNARGRDDLILVDHMEDGKHPSNGSLDVKKENLAGKQYGHYYDKKEFLRLVQEDALTDDIECIIHMGACSSTTLQDAEYFKENNLEYTRYLAEWALKYDVRFIYASSAATYGDGSVGYSDDNETIAKCKPLNLYGQSKQDFDQWVLDNGLINKMVGLKFFNVYGPNEYHKKDMRSVVAKAYQKVVKEGKMQLFKSYKNEYSDGEQRRD